MLRNVKFRVGLHQVVTIYNSLVVFLKHIPIAGDSFLLSGEAHGTVKTVPQFQAAFGAFANPFFLCIELDVSVFSEFHVVVDKTVFVAVVWARVRNKKLSALP